MLNDFTQNPHPKQRTAVASFFFHRRGDVLQYTPLGLFRSLLHQLLSRDRTLLIKFATDAKFEEQYKNKGKPGASKK